MSSKTMVVCIFCSLMVSNLMGKEPEGKTLKITFPQGISKESIENSLTQMGITFDEHSTINIHEEENYIDLICFNCIIRSVDNKTFLHGSFNERPSK